AATPVGGCPEARTLLRFSTPSRLHHATVCPRRAHATATIGNRCLTTVSLSLADLTSHTFTNPYESPQATDFPSDAKSIASTFAPSSKVRSPAPLLGFQSLTIPSTPQLPSSLPSRVNATALMMSVRAAHARTDLPAAPLQ